MTNDRDIMDKVRHALDDCTRSVDQAPSLRFQILTQAKGEPPVKKKFSAALALAMVMILLFSGAVAAALTNSGVLYWLFRDEESNVPQEVTGLVHQHDQTFTGDAIALTLNETLYDGSKLSVSLTMCNPTDELLIYTIGQAQLDGQTLVTESALLPYGFSHGQALGGQVQDTAIPNETAVFATFRGVSPRTAADSSMAMCTPAPLQPTEGAAFSIRVDAYRPTLPLSFLAPGEHVNDASARTADGLAIERDSFLLPLQTMYMEKVDSQVYTFPIRMSNAPVATVSAVPGVYENDLFSLTVEEFTLSATGGLIRAGISIPSPAAVKDQLPEDLSFFYVFPQEVFEQARSSSDWTLARPLRTQSGGGSVDPEDDGPAVYHVDASFGPTTSALPQGVYLVWMTGNTGTLDWDTALFIPMQ